MELAPDKTKLLHFNRKHIPPGEIKIKVQNHVIKSTETVKFLGIYFDPPLSFDFHVNHLVKKCKKALNIIKFPCGTWWGSDPETLFILYKNFIRSIIDYSSYIYCPFNTKSLEKIQKIENAAIRIPLGYRITTPINVLHAESKIIPLFDRIKYLCHNYLSKIISNTGSLTYKCILNYYNIFTKKRPKNMKIRIIIAMINNYCY